MKLLCRLRDCVEHLGRDGMESNAHRTASLVQALCRDGARVQIRRGPGTQRCGSVIAAIAVLFEYMPSTILSYENYVVS